MQSDRVESSGRVAVISEKPIGDVISVAAASGGTLLTLEDSSLFELPGRLQIIDPDGVQASEIISFNGVDSQGRVVLLAPIISSWAVDAQVFNYPSALERFAFIRLDDEEGNEDLEARVPLDIWDLLPLGIREDGYGENVDLLYDGLEWYISDITGQAPLRDPSVIDNSIDPKVPLNLIAAFYEADKRGGHRRWNGIAACDRVTKDVEENPIVAKQYIFRGRPVHPTTLVPITEANGGGWKYEHVRPPKDPNDTSQIIAKFPHLARPHYWKWEFDVMARARFHNDSDRSATTPPAKPATFGPPAPQNMTIDIVGKHHIIADWDNDDADGDTDGDTEPMLDKSIAHYKVKKFKNGVKVGKTRHSKLTHASWKHVKLGANTYRFDVNSVDHYGNISSTATVSTVARKPGKVTNRSLVAKTRGVLAKWDPPIAWSDGSTTDWSKDDVQYYETELWRAGAPVDSDLHVMATRKWWPMTKAEAALTGYSQKTRAIGSAGEYTVEDAVTGSVTPEGLNVTSGDIGAGEISYSHFSSVLPGGAPSASWSVTTSGSPPRGRLVSGPTGYKTGDMLYNTLNGKLYKFDGSIWWAATDGTELTAGSIIADNITSGTFTGLNFYGGVFKSSSGTSYVEMSNTLGPAIDFFDAGTHSGRFLALGTSLKFVDTSYVSKLKFSATGLNTENGADLSVAGTLVSLQGHTHSYAAVSHGHGPSGSHDHTFAAGGSHSHNLLASQSTGAVNSGTVNAHTHNLGTSISTETEPTHGHSWTTNQTHSH